MSRRGARRRWAQTIEYDHDVRAVWFGFGALAGGVVVSCGWLALLLVGR